MLHASLPNALAVQPNPSNMELKIRCECEQKIAFDAEPVDGHLGFELKCPNCGTVPNDQADAEIAARLASSPEERTVTSEAGTGAPAPAATAGSAARARRERRAETSRGPRGERLA